MVNVAIIGCGYWGSNFVRIAKNCPEHSLLWCCDSKKSNLPNPKLGSFKITDDYKDALKDASVDAVVVATPATTHYRIAKDCLESGKDVLVEKPITTNSQEALDLVKIAERNNRILMVGHIFEFNPGIVKLKEYMKRGELGETVYIHTSRTGLGPIRDDVNAVWDLASHDISILFYLIKENPLDIIARGQCYLQDNIEDIAFLTIEFEKKILANVHVSWLDPYKIRKITVVGSKKMAVFDDVNTNESLKLFDKGVSYLRKNTSFGEFKILIRDGDIRIPKLNATEPLKEEFNHFIECVEKRKQPLSNGYSGYKVVKVLEAAEESLKDNSKKVKIGLR